MWTWKEGRIYLIAAIVSAAVLVILTKAPLLLRVDNAGKYAAIVGITLAIVSGSIIGLTFWRWIRRPPPS